MTVIRTKSFKYRSISDGYYASADNLSDENFRWHAASLFTERTLFLPRAGTRMIVKISISFNNQSNTLH